MVKKLALFLVLMLSASILSAAAFGYGLSMEGWSGYNECSATRLTLAFDPTPNRYLTLEAGTSVGLNGGRLLFSGVNADLSVRTFSLVGHPFSFLFANPTLWSPKVSAGVVLDGEWNFAYRASLSLFNFLDVHFNYEFLKAFATFDKDFCYAGWGVELIRVSYYF